MIRYNCIYKNTLQGNKIFVGFILTLRHGVSRQPTDCGDFLHVYLSLGSVKPRSEYSYAKRNKCKERKHITRNGSANEKMKSERKKERERTRDKVKGGRIIAKERNKGGKGSSKEAVPTGGSLRSYTLDIGY